MRISLRYRSAMQLLSLACILAASNAFAGESTAAKGTLSVDGRDGPLSITFAHAYFVTGTDRFDETKTVRSIVFTADDQRAALDACADLRCAMLASSDGLQIELDDSGRVNWWAHIAPMQVSSTSGDALKLSVDSADRLAGTFKLEGSGATTAIEFDATLIRDFSKQE